MRQQLDSFNDFINTGLQEIVDENNSIIITPRNQHNGAQIEDEDRVYEVRRPSAESRGGRGKRDVSTAQLSSAESFPFPALIDAFVRSSVRSSIRSPIHSFMDP